MQVSNLYSKHQFETIYIIGTGPSLRLMPKEFFKGKITIGLNNAFQTIECTYNITIHPELIPKNWEERKQIWITKQKNPLPIDSNNKIYWFSNQKDIFDYSPLFSSDDYLYVGRGIQTGGVCLASKMGAETAIMVGCDFNYLGENHHATGQSVQFHGLTPEEVYNEYYFNMAQVRSKLKINILTLTPFLGIGHEQKDYSRLLEENNLASFTVPVDVSKYNRNKPDFTS